MTVAVLPLSTSGGNFRRHFRLFSQVLDVLESPGFWTGSSPGTTVPPEVPVLLPEVPPPRVFSSSHWQAFSGWAGSTALWAGTTGPAGFSFLAVGELSLYRAVVPPFGPVLPVLRDSVPNGQISQGTYLNVPSFPTV